MSTYVHSRIELYFNKFSATRYRKTSLPDLLNMLSNTSLFKYSFFITCNNYTIEQLLTLNLLELSKSKKKVRVKLNFK